ncbi:MAG: ChrR family anti-sigma-E factor [Paracoccaceae bacterium]|jgi:putative transcriptional regulator|nr:ChrR family anti-sigma-E factor [Paracoccaceae bacterium]
MTTQATLQAATPAVHQLDEEILAAYAAGTLPEALAIVVAAQASICPVTRERLRELEAIGGGLLALGESREMALGSFEATLKKIAEQAQEPETDAAVAAPCAVLPAPIREYVGGGIDAVRWRPVGMGARQAILHDSGEASARLLHIPAGTELPDHGHKGLEMTLVLQGAFLDGDARYARGDVDVADEGMEHRPIADVGEDCVCLVACEGRLKFSGLLPRLAQPFIGI